MSTEGAALSHLRDVYYILTHDLGSVDIEALRDRCVTQASDVDADLIAPIVIKLAHPMLLFNTAIESADKLTKSEQSSTKWMRILAIVVYFCVMAGIIYLCVRLVLEWWKSGNRNIALLVPSIGKVLLGVLAFTAFMGTWLLMLNARLDELSHNEDVLKAGFWHLHNIVGGAYAMRYEAAVQQGNLKWFVNHQNEYGYEGSTLFDDCEARDADDPSFTCNHQLDVCATEVLTLHGVIKKSCDKEIGLMLAALCKLRTDGVDSYDRTALWISISSGIGQISKTISVSADADTSAQTAPLQATAAQTVVTDVLAPIMQNADVKTKINPASSAVAIPDIPDSTFTHMVSEMLVKIQALKYDLNIIDNQDILDKLSATFYGNGYPVVRARILNVIDKVQKAADARPPPVTTLFVDSATLIARVGTMGTTAWDELIGTIDRTNADVRTFLKKFKLPNDAPSMGSKIANMMAIILTVAGLLVLLMYVADVLNRLLTSTLDRNVAARSVIIAACLYGLSTVIFGSMVKHTMIRSDHNWETIKRNGQKLAHSLQVTEDSAVVLGGSKNIAASDAQNYINSAAITVRAYDACNSVTNGASVMPFPMMDLVVYVTVAIVVLASALYGVDQLKPFEKISNIRTLLRLRGKVMDGEMPAGLAKQLECCTPDAIMWQILTWLSVVVLFCMNIYVISNVQKTNNDYNRSLMVIDTCV